MENKKKTFSRPSNRKTFLFCFFFFSSTPQPTVAPHHRRRDDADAPHHRRSDNTDAACLPLLISACSARGFDVRAHFKIRDFHIAKREEDIGFYAGFVGRYQINEGHEFRCFQIFHLMV